MSEVQLKDSDICILQAPKNKKELPRKRFLSVNDVKQIYSISRSSLIRASKQNLIKRYYFAGKLLFKQEEIEMAISKP